MSIYDDNYAQLVRNAQLGDQDSLHRLAEAARGRLHEYVFRLTLKEDLTQDVVQETMLEMLKVFGKLRQAEKFWPWLCAIAFNKIRGQYGKHWRQKSYVSSQAAGEPFEPPNDDALAQVVTEELKQIVLRCIHELEPRHRAVLTMRCYEGMSYAEIAGLMHCSEIGVRALFYRAKKALARRLSNHGLEKGSLLIALIVFGKMTATSEAAAAQVSLTAATLQVGPIATLVAVMVGKIGVITALTVGALAVGSATVNTDRIAAAWAPHLADSTHLPAVSWLARSSAVEEECWYYFPGGSDTSVMVRLVEFDPGGRNPFCRVLQNQYANYHADPQNNTVCIDNCRAWNPDLSVMRLPTDSPDLSQFIAKVEARGPGMELAASEKKGLLITCRRQAGRESRISRIDRNLNVLEEEYFHFSWPESSRVVDNRDAMHKRGWTYFRITGQINGREVSGAGRLPFVFASSIEHPPWLKVSVGGNTRIVDTSEAASMYNSHVRTRYPGGTFFQGLSRPWMGLHTVDTIRRDAAERRLRFDTSYHERTSRAKVTVYAPPVSLVYTVNMEADVVETIACVRSDGQVTDSLGELRFDYLQQISEPAEEFALPKVGPGTAGRPDLGILWLIELIHGW
jgi:RNA polymerase sigma-70 factor (ECF subfamily)